MGSKKVKHFWPKFTVIMVIAVFIGLFLRDFVSEEAIPLVLLLVAVFGAPTVHFLLFKPDETSK